MEPAPRARAQFGDGYDNTGQLDEQNWRHVQFHERTTPKGGVAWNMMSDVCKHCAQASCMEVCPTNAIIRTEFDTVYIQPSVCNGCRDCIAACPYHVIGFDEQSGLAREVHVLLRPPAGQPDAGLRQGLPDRVDQVRRPEHDAGHRRRAPEPAPRAGHVRGAALRRQGVRRAPRAVPAHRQARGLRAARTRRTRCCRAATTCAATSAPWPRRCSAPSARSSRSAQRGGKE